MGATFDDLAAVRKLARMLEDFDPATMREITVRAWDTSASGMTSGHEWNLTGMMNNAYFRIKVTKTKTGGYVFQHPTTWMDPDAPEATTEAAFKWQGDVKVLNGAWVMGDDLPPLTLQVDDQGTIRSAERIYAGEPFTATVQGDKVKAKFGPFFEVWGSIDDGAIKFNNGATWWKMA